MQTAKREALRSIQQALFSMALNVLQHISKAPFYLQMNAICQASEPDASEYYERVEEKVAQIGAWQELTLVDAQPHEIPRLDTVSSARAGDRVEVYYPEDDEWCQGEVMKVSGDGMKHTVSKSPKQRVSISASRAQERGRSENNVGAFSEEHPIDLPSQDAK
jgi:hypothetical protein